MRFTFGHTAVLLGLVFGCVTVEGRVLLSNNNVERISPRGPLALPDPLPHGIGHTHSHETEDAKMDMDTGATIHGGLHDLSSAVSVGAPSPSSSSVKATPPDPHNHHSHAPVKIVLDDTDIHNWHHFPPTYLAADFKLDNSTAIFGEEFDETWDPEKADGHLGLMFVHVACMIIAYFGALPLGLGLRAANHPSHYLVNVAFLIVALLGWLAGIAYKAQTPERYKGAVHNGFGNVLLLMSIGLATLDSLGLIKRGISFYQQSGRSWTSFLGQVIYANEADERTGASRYEMVGPADHEDEQDARDNERQTQVVFALGEDDDEDHDSQNQARIQNHRTFTSTASSDPRKPIRPWLLRHDSPPSRTSTGSEGTLHDSPTSISPTSSLKPHHRGQGAFNTHPEDQAVYDRSTDDQMWPQPVQVNRWRRAGDISLTIMRRSQVIVAYVVFLTGITSYTGMCRDSYINTCAAHVIKGSIFFLYGIFTFGRYLGAYADLGWAWNRRPHGYGVSFEMVECALIFIYGITNTWMERFGSNPGDPYSVKQVQHISIAVMFWFGGLMGMLLESKYFKKVLAAVTVSESSESEREPPSYSFSYNPIPALIIAVTGLAMAAHHQDYEFQVSIHSLWGILLALGSLFRIITYLFLWSHPPTDSVMPSRPPSEILAAFGMCSGGIVFMLSTEEVAYAAMRAGYDDMMAFLNVTIALNCLLFCWCTVILGVKGMAVLRMVNRSRRLRLEFRNGEGQTGSV